MLELNHILMVSLESDKEDALFDWTLELARQNHSKVTVLKVLPEVDEGLLAWFKNVDYEALIEKQITETRNTFQDWIVKAKNVGVSLETKVEFGKTFYQAIQVVLKHSVDLVVKPTDEEFCDLETHIFGSHDMHLLRKCPCPVLLLKHNQTVSFKKIMACIDVNLDSKITEPDQLNQSILGLANELTTLNNASLYVVHAWLADAENLMHFWNSDLSDADLIHYTESVRKQHSDGLANELKWIRKKQPNLKAIMPEGDAADSIPLAVLQNEIDLLVMGTLGRNGLPGMIIGNTSETILEKVNCSVLALKPKGFESPIKLL